MRKATKSLLLDKLNMEQLDPIPESYIAIIDMGFLWRLSTPSVEEKSDSSIFTWGDYASKVFSLLLT